MAKKKEKAVTADAAKQKPAKVKSTKTSTIITYVIALACLIAGLFVPLYGAVGENGMLFQHLPDAINASIGMDLIPLQVEWFKPFEELFVIEIATLKIGLSAILVLLYALVTVFGVIMLLPVLFGKRAKNTSIGCAYVVEVLAGLVLTLYVLFSLYAYAMGETEGVYLDYWALIALGGPVLMLLLQTLINKKGLGFVKAFTYILSAIAALGLFSLTMYLPFIAEPIENFCNMIKSNGGFIGEAIGFNYFYVLFVPTELIDIFTSGNVQDIIITLLCVLTALWVVINLLIDTIGLATGSLRKKVKVNGKVVSKVNTNTASKVIGIFRYGIEFILALALIVAAIVIYGFETQPVGVCLYAIALISALQCLIAFIRALRVPSIKKREREKENQSLKFNDSVLESEHSEEVEIVSEVPLSGYNNANSEPVRETVAEQPVEEHAEEPVEEKPEPAPAPAPMPIFVEEEVPVETHEEPAPEPVEEFEEQLSIPVEEPVETHTYVYQVKSIYNGPTDEFMNTLTDEEKIEFSKTFIEKSRGNLPRIPDYEIGGDNSDFFPSIFIYLNKFRAMLSPKLMSKIYKYLNK